MPAPGEAEELPEEEAPTEPDTAPDFADLCDALRDKYSMSEGDWKTLLEQGRTLYTMLPLGTPLEQAIQRVRDDSALQILDFLRRDLDPIIHAMEEQLRDAVPRVEEVEPDSEEEKTALAVGGGADAVRNLRRVVLYRLDTWLHEIGTTGNPGPRMQPVVEAATARMPVFEDEEHERQIERMRRQVAAAALE